MPRPFSRTVPRAMPGTRRFVLAAVERASFGPLSNVKSRYPQAKLP